MNMNQRLDVISTREQRLDGAYWRQVQLIDELIREYTPEHEMELQYWRLERIADLILLISA